MPVEFLTDAQAATYGCYAGPPTTAELDRCFLLDGKARGLIESKWLPHTRLGYAVQLTTLLFIGRFLADPTDVPTEVVDYLAEQLGIADPSCVKDYRVREMTRLEHAAQIRDAYGFVEFTAAAEELTRWVDDRAWTTGDGPTALFDGAVVWLREHRVLLPGGSTLVRLVAQIRDAALQRLWDTLAAALTAAQASALELLLEIPDGARTSDLERLRRGPTRVSGRAMAAALDRVSELSAIGVSQVEIGAVPRRRVIELARYGMTGKAPALRRHPYARRLATLLSTVVVLQARATDDAVELFDVLMTTELLARTQRQTRDEQARRYPRVSKDAGKLAAAVGVMLEATTWGPEITLELLWDAIEAVVSRAELRAAVANITDVVPAPGTDPGAEWRATLVDRFAVVRPFLPMLCTAIVFGATAEATPVLDALRALPDLLDARPSGRVPAGYLDARKVAVDLVPPGWTRVVFTPDDPRPPCTAPATCSACWSCSTSGYVAATSSHSPPPGGPTRRRSYWRTTWEAARGPVLNALQLPPDPDALLAEHARDLDAALRHVAGRLIANTEVRIDEQGRLHAGKIDAVPDPPSLTDLRRRCDAMLPRVDIGEVVLEVMSWLPESLRRSPPPPAARPASTTWG